MTVLLIDLLSWACLVAGGVFCIIGAVGLLRMPDFYTRMHAASVVDTLGAGLILLGLMLQGGWTLVTAKLAMIGLLLLFASVLAAQMFHDLAMLLKRRLRLPFGIALGMAVVLGLSIGVAYGAPRGGQQPGKSSSERGPRGWQLRAQILADPERHLSCTTYAGLAGFVEYPTQELVSGLLPLDQLQLLGIRSFRAATLLLMGLLCYGE